MIQAITWDVTPEIVDGWSTPNWYGLLFVSGLIIGYFVVKRMYKKAGVSDEKLDKLVMYMILATIIGARLGHVFFYGPYWDGVDQCGFQQKGYLDHPEDIFKIWQGGLASHGGAIAILIALYMYSKRVVKRPMLWILDKIVAPIAIAGMFIRLGNLVNSEIVGDPSNVSWAFKFVHYKDECGVLENPAVPRHPAQLYEAISYLFSFGVLFFMYWKRQAWKRRGVMFGAFLILIFGFRFLIEFVKVGQTSRDAYLAINTGQILSIPFVLAGLYFLWRGLKTPPQEEEDVPGDWSSEPPVQKD